MKLKSCFIASVVIIYAVLIISFIKISNSFGNQQLCKLDSCVNLCDDFEIFSKKEIKRKLSKEFDFHKSQLSLIRNSLKCSIFSQKELTRANASDLWSFNSVSIFHNLIIINLPPI